MCTHPQKHSSSRRGCRLPPRPSLPVASSALDRQTGFITRLISTCDHEAQRKELYPDFKGRVPEQLCLCHPTLTQQSHLLCHCKASRQGPQHWSQRAACLKGDEIARRAFKAIVCKEN